MIVCYIAYYVYIVYLCILQLFFTLIINDNNYLYYHIIVYRLNIIIFKISIKNYLYFFIAIILNPNLNNIFIILSTRKYSFLKYKKKKIDK